MRDELTFFLSFLAVFGGLAAYLWHLDRTARRLEGRVATLEAETTAPSESPASPTTAKAKPPEGPA